MILKITENQFKKLLLEETEGIESFLSKIIEKYPESEKSIDLIRDFIIKSECKKIDVIKFSKPAYGISLSDRVLINETAFMTTFTMFIFIVFHEIAHQYQYKKYGEKKMYDVYLGDLSLEDGAIWMKHMETVADEFATRKVREVVKMGGIEPGSNQYKGFYKNVPLSQFQSLIAGIKAEIKRQNIKDSSKISEMMYNWVKQNV